MKINPTYTAIEIKQMSAKMDMDINAYKVLVKLIDEEIDLYEGDDLVIIAEASMMLFTRSLLLGSLKYLK